MEERKIVFIGGLHRSGTTLLADCVAEHPNVSAFRGTSFPRDEGQFLQSVYPIAQVYGGPGRFGFQPEARLTEYSHLATTANSRKLWEEWSAHWDLSRPVLLEKSPPNLLHYRFLQKMFPGSYLITIIRHPIAVSLSTQKWSKTPLPNLIEHWLTCHEIWREDRAYLERELVFQYEDFVQAPQETLNRVFAHIGVRPVSIQRNVASDSNKKYYEQWERRKRRWLHRRACRGIIHTFEERVSQFGYSLLHCDPRPIDPSVLGA